MRWKVLGSYRVYHGLLRCRTDLLHSRKGYSSWLAQAAGYLLNCLDRATVTTKVIQNITHIMSNTGLRYILYQQNIQLKSSQLELLT